MQDLKREEQILEINLKKKEYKQCLYKPKILKNYSSNGLKIPFKKKNKEDMLKIKNGKK